MAYIDSLKILITGDTAGIETAVKQALNIVEGGVNAMNEQEVDWTGIFSRAVSPAIISGVASVFAFAISQAVNFQTAMATTGTAAGDSTSQIAALSQSALNVSATVPASAQDVANAMVQVSQVFGNTADQAQIVTEMAQLSAAGFGSLSDIVNAAVPIFQQFGVTTTAQATQVLTDLMHAAEGAKESIPELSDQFSSFSNQLPGADKSLTSFNGLVSTFAAEIQNLGSAGAEQIFSALGTAANGSNPALDALGGGLAKITSSLLSNGGLSAIEQFSTTLKAMGPNAALIATNMGLSAQQVGQFQVNASKLPQVATDAKNIATNTQSIKGAFDQADVGTNKLLTDWNALKAGFLENPFWNIVAQGFVEMAGIITGSISGINDALKSLATGSWIGDLEKGFKQITSSGLGSTSQLNSMLTGSGAGFSASSLAGIDSSANSNNLVQSLISALQTGIKSGQYTTLVNTFHLNVPTGSTGLVSSAIAKQLYQQFQGTQ